MGKRKSGKEGEGRQGGEGGEEEGIKKRERRELNGESTLGREIQQAAKRKPKKAPIRHESVGSGISQGGRGGDGQWNFEVEYNDHFETPQQAYVDLLQVLKHAAKDVGKTMEDLIVYDPYYCNGRVVSLLNNVGIRNVVNQNRDFYEDIRSHSLPGEPLLLSLLSSQCLSEFDILVTNPPYSGEHKQQLIQYLSTIAKPFALLLPAYTATKAYWRDFVQQENVRWKVKGPFDSIIYLLPPVSYEYSHPEGTGPHPSPIALITPTHSQGRTFLLSTQLGLLAAPSPRGMSNSSLPSTSHEFIDLSLDSAPRVSLCPLEPLLPPALTIASQFWGASKR
jgi:hypothetical protein